MAMPAYNKYYTEQQRGNTHSFEGERERALDCRYKSRVRKRLRECGCMGGVLCVVSILLRIEPTCKDLKILRNGFLLTSVILLFVICEVSGPYLFQTLKQLVGMKMRNKIKK